MTIEVSILISAIAVAFAIYQGITNNKRNQKADDKTEASQLTTVIVKLENIGLGITEIKSEMGNVKNEMKDIRERTVKLEEAAKNANRRMDTCEQHCNRFLVASNE